MQNFQEHKYLIILQKILILMKYAVDLKNSIQGAFNEIVGTKGLNNSDI